MVDVLSSLDSNLPALVASISDSPATNGGRKLVEFLEGMSQLSIQLSPSDVPWPVLMIVGISVAGALILLLLLSRGKSRRNRRRPSRFH